MTWHRIGNLALAMLLLLTATPAALSAEEASKAGRWADPTKQAGSAKLMISSGGGTLAPVYAPLADYLVQYLELAGKKGVGIDVGGGPGTLVVELAKRTDLHWINSDINPHFFGHFYDMAEKAGVSHQVSAVRADATRLPFRDGYADVIVSRGSFHFWGDRTKGFAEIYRVLAPGGVAYIGRGFSPNLPPETARRIRAKQGKKLKYDRRALADDLRAMMTGLGIRGFEVHVPCPPGAEGVSYGVWVEFRKPKEGHE